MTSKQQNQTCQNLKKNKERKKVLKDDAWVITWGSHCSTPSFASPLAAFTTLLTEIRVSSVKASTERCSVLLVSYKTPITASRIICKNGVVNELSSV
jgi:hypothetical protein